MRPIRHGSRDREAVAITFDDGPGPQSGAIIDRLRSLDARATFFLVGSRVAGNSEIVARLRAEGHEIGSHSWSHSRLAAKPGHALAELTRTSLAIRRAAGTTPRWFRPPYADSSAGLGAIARLGGMRTVTWDVDPRDWESPGADEIAENVLLQSFPGSVVLLHEGGEDTLAALPTIVRGLRQRGLALVTVSALLGRA